MSCSHKLIDLFLILFLSSITFLDASKDIGLRVNIHCNNLAKFFVLVSYESSYFSLLLVKYASFSKAK